MMKFNKKFNPYMSPDWEDSRRYYENYHLDKGGTPNIECLIRLVSENMSNRGNEGELRANLLGVLHSEFMRANSLFWITHKLRKKKLNIFIPLVYWYKTYFSIWINRFFNTKSYKRSIELCDISKEVINEMEKEDEK